MTTARRKPTKATAAKTTAVKSTPAKTQAKATQARKTSTARTKNAATRASTATKATAAKSASSTAKAAPTSGASAVSATSRRADGADVIVLTGPPSLLRATVSVQNAVDQRVFVRGLTLHRSGQQALTGSGAAVIAPGATAALPVSFRLEQDTPPGEYPAEVEVGGIRRQALLRVEPDLSMHVSPRRVLAEVGRQAITLTVANDGNLTIPLAAVVRAPADDSGPVTGAPLLDMAAGVRARTGDGTERGPDVTLTLTEAATLPPRTTTVIQGHLTVPAELDPARRHTARIPVGTADLDVIILPRDPSE